MMPQELRSHNDAQDLLLLQDYVCKLSHAQQTLEANYASLQQTDLLAGVIQEQDCRTIRTACCCLNSLCIRVEARANVTERAVISRQLQLVQASVQPRLQRTSTQLTQAARPELLLNISMINLVPVKELNATEDFRTADTSCLFESLPNISLKSTVFAGEASRLQACINAAELAIIANSSALDTVLNTVCTTRVLCSSQ